MCDVAEQFAHNRPLTENRGASCRYALTEAMNSAVLAGRILFKDKLSPIVGAGIGLIITGVPLVELGAAH